MEDEWILTLYFDRDEAAISQTRQKYGSYCADVAGRILDQPEDIEEILSDTWLRAWNAIPPHRPVSLKLYLARITRNLSFDRFRSQTREKRGGGEITVALEELSQCLRAPGQPGDHLEAKELEAAVNTFLTQLPKRERDIFLRRYFYVESHPEIARRFGLLPGNVRTSLSRTRKKLKVYLNKEGFL